MLRIRKIRFLPALMSIGAASTVLAQPIPVATGVNSGSGAIPVIGLPAAKSQNSSGLDFEGLEQEQLEALKKQAREFIAFRRGNLSSKERLFLMAECFSEKGQAENIYCDHILEKFRAVDSGSSSGFSATPEPRPSTEDLVDGFASAKLRKLAGVRESYLHKALEHFPDWTSLEPVVEVALSGGSCGASPALIALAQKAEEFFPDEKYRNIAAALFNKAIDCGDHSSSKARYRLSLLYIWAKQYEKADPLLAYLIDEKNGEFVSRSLYWRAQVAQAMENKLLAGALKGRLMKEHPLSYHSLVLSGGESVEVSRILDITDPVVRFRSERKPELTQLVRGVEMLQELRANDLALELLRALQPRLENTETSFRLYVALLLARSGETIGQFQVLSSIFSDQPSAISRATLQMFYPLKWFDLLKKHARKVDPLLVAALIRQESAFAENARSPAGALGLMQVMPDTARRVERVSHRRLMNPTTNVRIGVKYFRSMLDRYDGDAELALAAYNAGPEKVDDWKRRYQTDDRMLFFDLIPYRETRNYVVLIARNYYWYLNLYSKNPATQQARAKRARESRRKPVTFTLFSSI